MRLINLAVSTVGPHPGCSDGLDVIARIMSSVRQAAGGTGSTLFHVYPVDILMGIGMPVGGATRIR